MRRKPNPRIAIPSLLLGLLAAVLGWVVTSLSCDLSNATNGCVLWSVIFSAVSFLLVTFGTAVILGLVYRSLAEWRESVNREP